MKQNLSTSFWDIPGLLNINSKSLEMHLYWTGLYNTTNVVLHADIVLNQYHPETISIEMQH